MSITAAKTVAVAATATAEALGSAEAAKRFMAELKGARHVKEIMSAAQQRRFARLHGFEPIFDQSKSVTHDHVEMAASRSLKVAELEQRLAEVEGEILLVGCGSMEIHKYAANPRYVLHFHASESKDTSRSLQVMASEARRRWRDGLSARERFSLRNLSVVHQTRFLALDAVAKLANGLSEAGEGEVGEMDWRRRKAARIVVSRSYPTTTAVVAACFDSVYSMGEKGINALLRSGIQEIYGTMFAPYELLWRDVVTHPWYVYREHQDVYGRTVSQVAFSSEFGGYSGGYTHLKEDWAWLLNNQAWTSVATDCQSFESGATLSVVSEIISWDGPMLAFKVVKTAVVDNPVRAITLPKWARYVKVLDLFKSFDAEGRPKKKVYFSVSEAGVESLMTYLFGVKPTDVHALVAVGYIRRHMHGMEMAGNVHEESWGLDEENVYGLAVVASALAWGISSQVKVVLDKTDNLTVQDSNWRKFLGFLKTSAAVIASIGLIIPAKMLWDWLVADSLIPDLMIKPGHVIWQQRMGGIVAMEDAIFKMDPPTARFDADDIVGGTADELAAEEKELKEAEAAGETAEDRRRRKVTAVRKEMADGGYAPMEDAGELLGGQTGCYLCDRWRGKMGAQVTRCSHVEDNSAGFDWSLEEADVLAWKNELIEAAKEAPTNLAKVIKQAYEGMPGGEWRLEEVETYLVESGPGTGKSFGARLLYDETTLFYAPFGKLRVDYMQKEHNGVKVDMAFKTTHQGMYYSGTVETLVVDEFTAMDRRAVCTMLRKTGAKRVLLFGDRRQTGLMASEGAPILAYNDLSRVSKHEFLVNFRNEAWYVALLNLYYGYEMRAFKGGFVGPEIAGLEDFAKEATERVSINFSHATAADTYSAEGHTNSVRANQGSTHPTVGLVIGDTDTAHLQNPQLLRVAFSRQQESLKVYGDSKSPAMALVKQALHMEDEMLWADEDKVRKEYVAKNVGRQLVVAACEEVEEKAAELDVVAESVVVAAEAKAVWQKSVAARTYTSFFGVVGERVDDAEEASTLLENQRLREESAAAEKKAAAEKRALKLHEAYLAAVEASAEADKEFCEKDAPLSKVMSVVFPFLGKLSSIIPATLDAAADFLTFIKSVSWCSLVAVCRVMGFTTRTVTSYLVFTYEKFVEGAGVAADGVSDFVLQQFFLDRGIAAWVVEKAAAAFPKEKGEVVKVLRPVEVEMSPMTILAGTPGHIDFFAPLEEEMLAERKMTLKHGGGLFGAKTVEVFCSVAAAVRKYNLFGKYISLRSAVVTGAGYELRVLEAVELRGMLYQACGMRSSEMVNLSVEEAAVLEHMELGPMPSEMKVEAIVPVMLLPEFETPELVSTMEEKPSYDAFRHLCEFDSVPGLGDTKRCANEEAAVAGQLGQVRGGKLDANVRDPINKRFRPVETVKRAEAISIGDGNHFFAGDRAQAVQSAAHRYMKKGRGGAQILTDEGKRLAWKMADEFRSECMRDELHIDADAEAEAWQDWIKASRRKSYVKRAMAEPEEYKTTINYFCKNQYKPAKNGKCDHMKVGQGISAWSARAVGECGGHIRLANLRFLLNLKENVVYDNKITEEALARQVNMMVDRLPTGVKSATTDVVEMDSIQDIFTQEIERRLLWWLGFGAQFVDYYYSFRSQYPLLCRGVFTATGGSEKTSGEPGTLLFNSILSAVFANYLMRGVGEFVMVIKGDDNNKWQQGLALHEVRYSAVKAQSHYRMVITFGQAEFCGKIITEGAMLPSVNRTVAKLVAQRFRNMAHFYEYQKAVRDKVKMMKRIGTEKVLMATAQVHGMNLPAVRANWDALESFSYLSYKQFSDVKMEVYTSSGIIGMFD